MIALSETTIATTLAVIGVIGTLVWYGLAWYSIRTLTQIRDALSPRSPDNE